MNLEKFFIIAFLQNTSEGLLLQTKKKTKVSEVTELLTTTTHTCFTNEVFKVKFRKLCKITSKTSVDSVLFSLKLQPFRILLKNNFCEKLKVRQRRFPGKQDFFLTFLAKNQTTIFQNTSHRFQMVFCFYMIQLNFSLISRYPFTSQ